jgi:hypothetical protein
MLSGSEPHRHRYVTHRRLPRPDCPAGGGVRSGEVDHDSASGEITSRLPGERALQQEFGLAPVTIRNAVHQLRDEGLVRTTPGWGTYVVKNDGANP